MQAHSKKFAESLIIWQKKHGRHTLPWQGTTDPYRIWLSEIMLQQTQVKTVIPYYTRFLEHFPDISTLAKATQEDVLTLWAGLGYYARGRNLHRCAQTICTEHQGKFPLSSELVATLPGIGRSTAAAICVFSYGSKEAILDGNAKRVFARCFGIEGAPSDKKTENKLWQLAESLLPDSDIKSYTQGLMDLGATLCSRTHPQCKACPVNEICVAFYENRQDELPSPNPKKKIPTRQTQMLFVTNGKKILLEQRPPSGIWGGMLALPQLELSQIDAFLNQFDLKLMSQEKLPLLKHTFTHFHLEINTDKIVVSNLGELASEPNLVWKEISEFEKLALPTPIKKIVQLAINQ